MSPTDPDEDGARARPRTLLAAGVLFAAGLVAGLAVMQPELLREGWERISSQRAEASGESLPSPTDGPAGDAWVRVRVGLPESGSAAQEEPTPPRPRNPEAAAGGGGSARPAPAPPSAGGPIHESVVVEPGATLWGLADRHYGRTDGELLDALSRHNHLESPDELRVGRRIWLPPIEDLLGDDAP